MTVSHPRPAALDMDMDGEEGRSKQRRTADYPRKRRRWIMPLLLVAAAAAAFFVPVASAQDILQNNNFIADHHHKFGCGCMEYWTCITSGGTPYSYCGINAEEVCCFVPDNAEPVGILPTPTRARCGKKGFDTGNEGEADMAEWPWHVREF